MTAMAKAQADPKKMIEMTVQRGGTEIKLKLKMADLMMMGEMGGGSLGPATQN